MKRIICLTIALCLCFGAISPVFAVTDSLVVGFSNPGFTNSVSAYQVMTSIVSYLANISAAFTYDNNGYSPIDNILLTLQHIEDWIVPSGSRPSQFLTAWDYLYGIAEFGSQLVTNSSSIISYVSSWMSTNNSNSTALRVALTNYLQDQTVLDISQVKQIAHRSLVSISDATYDIWFYSKDSNNEVNVLDNKYIWTLGTPLGNIALILSKYTQSFANFGYDFLKDFNDTLTTWEHSTHTQTTFTPSSLANGLYRYLAYIQSDTSYNAYNNNLALNRYLPSRTDEDNNEIWTPLERRNRANYYLLNTNGVYELFSFNSSGNENNAISRLWSNGSPLGNIAYILTFTQNFQNRLISKIVSFYNNSQTPLSWTTANNDTSFTPTSTTNGIYTWLKNIQAPLARLAFVHADDTDIAMKQQEAANDTAVVNNFFGSGSAAASVSDFGDIASASAAAKSNLSTGVSASGVWAVFNDPNWSYLTQATADSLMPSQQTRSEAISYNYETPYLDRYTEAVYNIIGFSTDELDPEDEQR